MLHILEVAIYLPGLSWPTIKHSFYGVSAEESDEVFATHMQADSALRACVEHGQSLYGPCRVEYRREVVQ